MNRKFAALLLSTLALNACVAAPIAAGVGAAGGSAAAAARPGGMGQTYTDAQISRAIHNSWDDYNPNMLKDLDYKVFEARVMIVGSTPRSEFRDEAVKLAWKAPGVRQVINEIHVEPRPTFGINAKDTWISTQFKTKLLSDRGIQLMNYTFLTSGGVIYVIGTARDQEEMDLVLNHARNISYVRDVVSYIRMNGTDRPNPGDVQNTAPATSSSSPKEAVGYGSSNAPVTAVDSDSAVGSSYNPPSSANISSTDLPPVQ